MTTRSHLQRVLDLPAWLFPVCTAAVAAFLFFALPPVRHSLQTRAVQHMAVRVGATYGDAHPTISRMSSSEDPSSHVVIYSVYIDGAFRRGALTAAHLSFQAVVKGRQVGGIQAFNDGSMVWEDEQLPTKARAGAGA